MARACWCSSKPATPNTTKTTTAPAVPTAWVVLCTDESAPGAGAPAGLQAPNGIGFLGCSTVAAEPASLIPTHSSMRIPTS